MNRIRCKQSGLRAAVAFAVATLAWAVSAGAMDGTIEINQAKGMVYGEAVQGAGLKYPFFTGRPLASLRRPRILLRADWTISIGLRTLEQKSPGREKQEQDRGDAVHVVIRE